MQRTTSEATKPLPGQHRHKCTGKRKDGTQCRGPAVQGTDRCRMHAGMSVARVKAKGAVVAELAAWGLDGHSTLRDAGEVLLRLVTQAAWRVELYGRLLGEAYEAGDRLRLAYDHVGVISSGAEESDDPAIRQAADDVKRVFKTGGVGALIGFKWDTDRTGQLFKVEEAIRGLVKLEADERDRCANFAAKAVAAGLAERQVRLAERQGMLIVGVIRGVLDELELTDEQQSRVADVVSRQLRSITIDGEVTG